MSERREIVLIEKGPPETETIFREVLPGDTTTMDINWSEFLESHARLVASAKAYLDLESANNRLALYSAVLQGELESEGNDQ